MKVNNNITLSETSFDESLICLFENNKYIISIDKTHVTKNILSDNSSLCMKPFDIVYAKKNKKKFKTINLLI